MPEMLHSSKKLIKKRCICCNAMLCEADIIEGIVKIKCKCGTVNVIEAKHQKEGRSSVKDRLNSATKRTPA